MKLLTWLAQLCGRVYVTIRCPSILPSIYLSDRAPQLWHAVGLLLWAP